MESSKKWLYVSIRYNKILNEVILDEDYMLNGKFTIEDKSKVNSLYGDYVYKCNFLIYGDEYKIKELQDKNQNDFFIWVSCNEENQKDINVFNFVNTTKLNKNYGYVNFFEENIDNFKFKIKCENEEDFFKKFFNLCEKSINEKNKTLDDLLKAGLIEEINEESENEEDFFKKLNEEDFFKKFFNLCEKSINEKNKTLDDLLKA